MATLTITPAGGGGSGSVTTVGSGDSSIVVTNPTTTPSLQIATMDVLFGNRPPAAAVAFNAKKITGLANGTSSTDAAAFGQIPVQLAPTAVKTGAYNASAADLVLCNTSAASFTVTLPTAPADKTTIGIKVIVFGAGKTLTVAAGGSDVFNVASGAVSQAYGNGVNQGAIWQYIAATAVWLEIASDPSTATEDLALTARGLLAQTGDRGPYVGGDQAPATQVVYARLLGLRGGMVVTGIALENSTQAVTANPTTARAGLADATGKILVLSGNLNAAATWIGGVVQLAFTAPFTIPANGGYLACFVVNGVWGTPPTLARGRANNFAGSAMGAFAPDCVQWGGQTDLPAINSSITLGGGGLSFWMGAY